MDLIGSWYDRFECSKDFQQGRLFPLTHSEFIKRAHNEIIDHTGKGKDFHFSEMGSTLCIVAFF